TKLALPVKECRSWKAAASPNASSAAVSARFLSPSMGRNILCAAAAAAMSFTPTPPNTSKDMKPKKERKQRHRSDQNSKSEYRNPKQIRSTKFQTEHCWRFRISDFEFVSDFAIRISDLPGYFFRMAS